MKIIAINGSPRKEGNTFHALNIVGAELMAQGIEFEILHIGNKMIRGCVACYSCMKNKDEKCVTVTDEVNAWVRQLKSADGIILGSPVYFSGIAGTMKCFLDRLFFIASANGGLFRHKAGAAVVAVRRSGGTATFDSLNHYLTYAEMLLPTSNYWNVIHGGLPGEAEKDDEGRQAMRILGKNMGYLLKMREAAASVEPPDKEKKVVTSFIR